MTRTFLRMNDAPDSGIRGYAEALLLVALSTLIGLAIAPRWGNSAIDLLYLPAVLAIAVLAGLGPALLAAAAATLAYNYFFTAPFHTFRIDRPTDAVTVVVLFIVAAVTSQLAASIRKQAQLAEAHAARNATIAGFARRLLSGTGKRDIAEIAVTELGQLFECNAVLLAAAPEPLVIARAPETVTLTPSDIAAAAGVASTGRPTGRGISPVSTVEWQLHAVRSGETVLAVVGLARDDGMPAATADRLPLLENLLDQLALALERARLEEEAREFAAVRERDRLRSTMVSSIGEDLNPRLNSIVETVGELRRKGSGDKELVAEIGSQAMKMQRYITGLVELTPASDRQPIDTGGITIDLFHRSVSKDGATVHLTPKEYAVLAELAKHPGRVLSHAHLLRTVWGPAQEAQTEYLRVAVRSLRQKLERQPSRPQVIVNEPAVGYRLMVR